MKKLLPKILITLVIIAVGIQFIPVTTSNPPVEHTVTWANPQTKEFFTNACADCHSNETVWPWYAKLAPVSWWISDHVEHGREHFNISRADMGDADEAYEAVHEGWMPLESYTWMHPKARLTAEQKTEFSAGLQATFNVGESTKEHESHDGHDH
ncbi:heme-binding domain-containing protein [Cerasicoccus frondis]|uniref:heme-binding domain-containing protein n=1 Tax=Cerasicoccus frondis TaxID=490090 RepID=UPI00285269A3|nr:heme-binding domain-containing protein [Cerasicoccus frondis]